MNTDAYDRARKLLGERGGSTTGVAFLGVVQSLLVLALLTVVGLLAVLLTSQGEARCPKALIGELPELTLNGATGVDQDDILFDDSGLLSIVTANLASSNPVHRQLARGLSWVVHRVPTLLNNVGALATLLATGLVLLLFLCLVIQSRRGRLAELTVDTATAIRSLIHRQLYRLGQSSLATEGTGPALNLLTREVNDVRDGLFSDLDTRLRVPFLFVGLVLYSLTVDWLMTFFLASLGILAWLLSRRILKDSRLVSDAALRDASQQLPLIHEDMGMIRTVRVYGMEGVDKERFDQHLDRFKEADIRRLKTEGGMIPTLWLMYGAAAALAVGLIGYRVVGVHQLSPAGGLILCAALAGLRPLATEWLASRKLIRQANRSASGVFEYLDRKPELQQEGGATFLSPLHDKIGFENVSLESRSGRVLLDGVTAEIKAGTRTAIMGLDEDAKHALVCLIPRLIDPKVGRVRLDGQDLRSVTLESIRAQVATVLQTDLVFTDSVVMNIGLGDPSISMPRIIEAAKVAHAHNFIQDLPHGYDTVIGPVGHYLTPDEQYRIALARAYLHDPSIVILEEPNGPLEDDIKDFLDDTVSRLGQGRTLIILPHRLSTIRSCQQIIVLHNGRVEVAGPPKQLQTDSKLYRHLQYIEFNQFATGEIEAGQMA